MINKLVENNILNEISNRVNKLKVVLKELRDTQQDAAINGYWIFRFFMFSISTHLKIKGTSRYLFSGL